VASRVVLSSIELVLYGCENWSDIKGETQTEGVDSDAPSGSITCYEVLEYLHNWQPLSSMEYNPQLMQGFTIPLQIH
jgi:hypothetical protein